MYKYCVLSQRAAETWQKCFDLVNATLKNQHTNCVLAVGTGALKSCTQYHKNKQPVIIEEYRTTIL